MPNGDLQKMLDEWVYNVKGTLEKALDNLKDDLMSDDESTSETAANEASAILDWLCLSTPSLSDEERMRRAGDVIKNTFLSKSEQLAALQRITHSTGRRRGRPRTETCQYAIRALTLHLATARSWREIALEITGCKHRRPNPEERSCVPCGNSIRAAAIRLEKFLSSKSLLPRAPRRLELDKMSSSEIERVWSER